MEFKIADDTKFAAAVRKSIAPLLEEQSKAVEELIAKFAATLTAVQESLAKSERVNADHIKDLAVYAQALHDKQPGDVDFSGVIEALKENSLTKRAIDLSPVVTAIEKSAPKSTSMLDYRPHDQDTSDSVYQYYGFVHPSGAWYIVRNSTDTQRYAAGSGDYQSAWKARTKQKYGYLSEVM